MPAPTVRIRMYRQRFGDCFLLRFARARNQPEFKMLIDCGLITGGNPAKPVDCWPEGARPNFPSMDAVVDDIYAETSGQLDLLVGTHEHWDHLSAFATHQEKFKQFKVKKVWLPWTEDPANPNAVQLANDRAARLAALRYAVAQMTSPGLAAQRDRIQEVLSFFGDEPAPGSQAGNLLGAAGTTRGALENLKTLKDALPVHYCDPHLDPPLELEGVNGVRVYVLGPPSPKDKDDTSYISYIKMDRPTKKARTYGAAASAEIGFYAAVSAAQGGLPYNQYQELTYPFEREWRISVQEAQNEARKDDFFRSHYGFQAGDPQAWRRIDDDWLYLTGELALNLDSDTNNTSLVLAFELGEPGSGEVLLFAADAQVGNWLSWSGLSWRVNRPGQVPLTVTSHDLLKRAVFYKVGHHGSHNATLSEQGLELMTSDGLVAMIPVDECIAHSVKNWDEMPFDPLLRALERKTRGRIIRIDKGKPKKKPASLTAAEWRVFKAAVVETDLYIEYKR